jgi:hypothetical protein
MVKKDSWAWQATVESRDAFPVWKVKPTPERQRVFNVQKIQRDAETSPQQV